MLHYNLTSLFKARDISKPTQFLMLCSFSAGTATKIKQGNSYMLKLHYVEIPCEKLNCILNDLIEGVPSEKQKAIANHPLQPLQNKNYAEEVM